TNPDLLRMVQFGRAARPIDLLTYRSEDEQPSVFFLHEDDGQSLLAVFNWTEQSRSRVFKLSEFDLPDGHSFQLYDVLAKQNLAFVDNTIMHNDQPAHSVRLIKISANSQLSIRRSQTSRVTEKRKSPE